MDNKVVQTLARAFVQLGYRTVRFNFRGVGGSGRAGTKGRGEVDDALAVVAGAARPGLPLALAGFSFGAYVATQAATRGCPRRRAERLVLVARRCRTFRPPVPAGHAWWCTARPTRWCRCPPCSTGRARRPCR
jgi:alpha/beta superfamily hydrolase